MFESLAGVAKDSELAANPSVLSSLVMHLNAITSLLWDEEDEVMNSAQLMERYPSFMSAELSIQYFSEWFCPSIERYF